MLSNDRLPISSPFVFHCRKKITHCWTNRRVFLGELFICVCDAWCQSSPTREICLDSRVGLMTEVTEMCMFTKVLSELNEPKQSLLLLGKHQYRVSSKDVLFHLCVFLQTIFTQDTMKKPQYEIKPLWSLPSRVYK